MPQQTAVQKDFPAEAKEVVLSGLLCSPEGRFRPFYTKEEKAKAKEAMNLLKIEDLAGSCYRELSGGQQQRVLLARALLAAKKLLVMDEPAAGLDPVITSEFYELIDTVRKTKNLTIVMVSHDIKNAVAHAGSILHLGEMHTFSGTTQDYIHSPAYVHITGGDCGC
jgi:zinc transport system ATP-binding protein